MTPFAGVLNLLAGNPCGVESLLAAVGYIVLFAVVGTRWFQWEVR